jgi:formyl-CoA transferase
VFGRLALAMGQPELASDPRYDTHTSRGAHQAELDEKVGKWTQTLTTKEVLAILAKPETAVPSGLIYRAPDMLEDDHFAARNAIVEVPHPAFGTLKMQNVAPKLSETPGGIRAPSPELGEHNDEVYLKLLGLAPDRYEQLKSQKVI